MASPVLLLYSLFIWIIHSQMDLTLFPKNENGRQCLDGSPAGFYYAPPPSNTSDLWVIGIEGGGACHDEEKCMSRANSSLGSSNYWPQTIKQAHVLSNDPLINPDFYSGHKVYCKYCSSDIWSGQRTSPSSNPDTWGLYFSGHLIFEHIMQYLAEKTTFLDAKYILVTGGSAGGHATYINVDWLSAEFKQKGTNNATIKAAPWAGWVWAGNTTDQLSDPMMPPNDYPHWINYSNGGQGHNDSINVLWDSYLEPRCVNDLGANLSWYCGSVHNLYKYIETPLFIMQNKFDQHQLVNGFLLPSNEVNTNTTDYVEYFGIDTDRSIGTQVIDVQNDKNGLFYASCFDHTQGLGIGNNQQLTKINGYNSSELVGDWFWERNKLPHYVYDTCNNDTNKLPCNPTCNPYPPN